MLFCGDEDIVVMLLLICTCAFHDVLQLQYRLSIIAIFLLFNRTSHKDKGRFAAVLLLMASVGRPLATSLILSFCVALETLS